MNRYGRRRHRRRRRSRRRLPRPSGEAWKLKTDPFIQLRMHSPCTGSVSAALHIFSIGFKFPKSISDFIDWGEESGAGHRRPAVLRIAASDTSFTAIRLRVFRLSPQWTLFLVTGRISWSIRTQQGGRERFGRERFFENDWQLSIKHAKGCSVNHSRENLLTRTMTSIFSYTSQMVPAFFGDVSWNLKN